jgi:NAD(P)-dependent dehydrogenase (short-subunit alcohol dehydrogenase family)
VFAKQSMLLLMTHCLTTHNSRHLDLDLGTVFEQCGNLDEGHGGVIRSDDVTVGLTNGAACRQILLLVGDVPGHARDVPRRGPCFGQHGDDVLQRLAHLTGEVVRLEAALGVPADLPGDEDVCAFGGDAVTVAAWLYPSGWLKNTHAAPTIVVLTPCRRADHSSQTRDRVTRSGERGPMPAVDSTDGPLSGQHAVVTGGGRGIGAAIATELARLGAHLTLMGRTAATLDGHAQHLRRQFKARVDCITVDITDPASVSDAFASASPATILVNNAGAAYSAPFRATPPERWEAMIDINLHGPARCTAAVLPAMLEANYGRIINVASTAGLKGYAYVSAYVAAKHGLIGFTRALALEMARTGITVNAVCPGFTDTDLLADSVANIVATTGRSEEEARAALTRTNPQGRLIAPEEVAHTAGWLCLPESAAVTGQAIVVAGGEVM